METQILQTYKKYSPLAIATLIIAIVAAGSTYAYEKHQKQTLTQNLQDQINDLKSQLTAKDLGANHVAIPELGIELTVPTELKNLEYTIIPSNSPDYPSYAGLTTQELIEVDNTNCIASHMPLGEITVTSTPSSSDPGLSYGKLIKTVGNRYLYYITPQAICSERILAQHWQQATPNIVEAALLTATAIAITTPTPTFEPTGTITLDTKVGLKTYTSKSKGISFKYPINYIVEEDTTNALGPSIRVSNYPSQGMTLDTIPEDLIAMSIYAKTTPATLEDIDASFKKNLPEIQRQTISLADGSTASYYVLYSSQASDYSLVDGPNRLKQIFAYFTLSNGKSFTAQLANYEWTPKEMAPKTIDLIIQILKTISPA